MPKLSLPSGLAPKKKLPAHRILRSDLLHARSLVGILGAIVQRRALSPLTIWVSQLIFNILFRGEVTLHICPPKSVLILREDYGSLAFGCLQPPARVSPNLLEKKIAL